MTYNKCYFCGDNHTSRECDVERKIAPILKKKVGNMMEHYIADNLNCPECKRDTLKVIGNHSPSLDIICTFCQINIEVKSKCLSVERLPKEITIQHGCYYEFNKRIHNNLNIIIILYGVNRIRKQITIREILYIPNSYFQKFELDIYKKKNSNLTEIIIKNRFNLPNLLNNKKPTIDFEQEVNELLKQEALVSSDNKL